MDIRSLSYFVAVARQLSFSRAAESLYVSQSSLSKNIAALEKELGVSLFVRKGRGISLTPAGKALLEGAQSLLEQEESLAQSVRHMANASAGGRLVLQLRQPVPSCKSFCRALISCAQDFREEHAPLELEFRYDDSPTPISSLPSARDNVDIYFSMANEVKMDPALDIESLMEMPFYLFAADLILPEGEKPQGRCRAGKETAKHQQHCRLPSRTHEKPSTKEGRRKPTAASRIPPAHWQDRASGETGSMQPELRQ